MFPGKHKIHFFLAHVLLLVFQPSSVVPPAVTHKVIRGTPDRLLARLVDEGSNSDATYVEDFLLTHRTFYAGASLAVAEKLLEWFGEDGAALCDRVRIIRTRVRLERRTSGSVRVCRRLDRVDE